MRRRERGSFTARQILYALSASPLLTPPSRLLSLSTKPPATVRSVSFPGSAAFADAERFVPGFLSAPRDVGQSS